ncbi:MAG: hypothetical protein QMD46_09885 [Methanomicrobiales archaeon]|nr:hypothetical protein [Methanomicrobiales archaeon]MDI6876788.1 hypothetical protein [Methanomicrobiales archaeon]
MDSGVLIVGILVGAALLAYVVVPGLIIVWDRVLDHVRRTGSGKEQG